MTEERERVVEYATRMQVIAADLDELVTDMLVYLSGGRKKIRDIVKDLEREHGTEIPEDDVYDFAYDAGYVHDEIKEQINAMLRDGILYRPYPDTVSFVR